MTICLWRSRGEKNKGVKWSLRGDAVPCVGKRKEGNRVKKEFAARQGLNSMMRAESGYHGRYGEENLKRN